jgi:gliding motility-associated-like protein
LPDCESPLSNSISTVFIDVTLDSCKKEISVKWNSYSDFPRKVLGYEIRAFTVESSLPVVYTVNPDAKEFSIKNFKIDKEYFFTVNALLDDGNISGSVTDSITTSMTRPPEWINADFATVTDEGSIALSFTADPLSEIKRYRLEKKEGFSGQFQLISELFSNNGDIKYIDNKADVNKINIYRLSAINFCGIPVTISNLSSDIVVSASSDMKTIDLSWNSYREWLGNTSYRLLLNTGNGYREIALPDANDTTCTLSYQDIMYQVTGSMICFKVAASESGNPHAVNGESISAEKCLDFREVIIVPDLFTPDGDLVNDLFKPVLSFLPREYHLVISDRRGKVLFETRDHQASWDGTWNGNPLPGDSYLWFLQTKGPSGKTFSRTGTITIFRNR